MTTILHSSPSNSHPKLAGLNNIPKSTVILSEVPDNFFVKNPSTSLSPADEIKLLVLNYQSPENIANKIRYFSPLPFLQRIVIVFKEEPIAREIYSLLKHSKFSSLKINLSTTLIRTDENNADRSLSIEYAPMDSNFTNKGRGSGNNMKYDSFIASYEEPMPKPGPETAADLDASSTTSNASADDDASSTASKGSTKTLLSSLNLTLNTADLGNSDNTKHIEHSPTSPSITLDTYEL